MKVYQFSLLFLVALVTAKKDYTAYNVLKVTPENIPQLRALKNLQDSYNGISEVQFWNSALYVNRPVKIQVAPTAIAIMKKQLAKHGLTVEVVIDDLQRLIDDQAASMAKRRQGSNDTFHLDGYNNFVQIYTYLEELTAEYEGTQLTSFGTTFEGREMYVFSIASGDKPAIALECNIHGREWITGAVCVNLIANLVTNPAEIGLKDAYDWYFMPIANPDGFSFSMTNDRMWRKNRRYHQGMCDGVDPDRNFDADFGGSGSDPYQCNEDYHGEAAFSEAESQAERDFILSLKDRLLAYWSFHSYGDMYLLPYCYTYDHPASYDEMLSIAQASGKAVLDTHGTNLTVGPCALTDDLVSGGAYDWVYDTVSPKFVGKMLLRDEGRYGFLLPEDQIIPVYEEVWNGMKAALEAMK